VLVSACWCRLSAGRSVETGEAGDDHLGSAGTKRAPPALAIFFWFVSYNAVEAFFTLYANKHLGMGEADGARLLGQLSLLFVLFALPSGYIGGRFGRRITIMTGIVLMTAAMLLMYFLPVETLVTVVTRLPVLGVVPVVGLILMLAGIAWSLININSLPMVVDMTTAARIGTFTGLYYLASTWRPSPAEYQRPIVQLTGSNYGNIMLGRPCSWSFV
jgi:MFS family permease